MGPLASAVLIGCLNGLQWLLWLTAGLLLLLVVTQFLRGDADAMPVPNLIGAIALAILGYICGFAARKLLAR